MWWILSLPLLSSIALFGLLVLLTYYYGTNTYDYWKKKGVPYIEPRFPFLGTMYEVMFGLKTLKDKEQEIYNYFKGHRFGGMFLFKTPALFINDPDLIESILIKDFTSFYNRRLKVDPKLDQLSTHLFNLKGLQWKSLRKKLSPVFSTVKLKGMYQQMVECSDELTKYIGNQLDKSEPMEVREIMAKLAIDVIGTCLFGLNTNALKDPDSEFLKVGNKIFQPSYTKRLRLSIRNQNPAVLRLLQWKGMSEHIKQFFTSMINTTMEFREKNNEIRNDFLQLFMELKRQEMEEQKSGPQENDHLIIDDDVIASNAHLFFVAGFETVASTLSFCLYELSLHQDIQEQAYQHIVSVLKNHGDEFTYNALKDMTFINQIFAETLRIHCPVIHLVRDTTKNFVLPGTNLMLPKDFPVVIPLHSLHNDPEYFPEPTEFKPERFNNERDNIRKGTYIPFSDGPRNCIGKSFAKMEMHVALVKLLLKYKFALNSKTISPLIYSPEAILLTPVGGIWLDAQKRI